MSVIRVNFLPEFEYGYDAVLLTMDGAGVTRSGPRSVMPSIEGHRCSSTTA